jgi:hypothetical protein
MKNLLLSVGICTQMLFYSCNRHALTAQYDYAKAPKLPKSPASFLANQALCEDEWKYLLLPSASTFRVLFYEPGFGFDMMQFPDLLVGVLPSGDTIRILNKDTGKFSKRVRGKKRSLSTPVPLIQPGDMIEIEQDSSVTSKLPLLATHKGIEGLRMVGCHLPGIIPFDTSTINNTSICSVQNTFFVKITFPIPQKR